MIYEVFSFVNFFRLLLKYGYNHEDALMFMLAHCSFSAYSWQECIDNKFYRKLSAEDALPPKEAARKALFIADMLEVAGSDLVKSKRRKAKTSSRKRITRKTSL
jgi:hypothetical protein